MRRSLHLAVFVVAVLLGPVAAAAQTLDAIIAKNLEAKGGAATLKGTNSVRMTARLTAAGQPGEMSMTMLVKRPNMFRRELSFGDQTMAFGFDGTTAWARRGDGEAQPLTGPMADQLKIAAEFDSVFLSYKEDGHTLELVGPETVGGKASHHVKVTRKDGQIQHYYLDAGTGLEHKMVIETEQGGMKLNVETELSDYRTVDGRVVPFRMRQLTNGSPSAEVTTEKIEFNLPLDDAVFRLPSK